MKKLLRFALMFILIFALVMLVEGVLLPALSGGEVGKVLPGKSIGGDRYYNREGLLPKAEGRIWTECDVGDRRNTRGAERIVFSNDGLVYYTPDHYDSFELLYGEP